MRAELVQFIQAPSCENYLALRKKVIESDKYQPYSDEIDDAEELCEQQNYQAAAEVISKAMENLVLSPRVHQLNAFLHHKLGDERTAEAEMLIAFACLDGILATGDGSADKPYIVVRTSDEYDVLAHLEKQFEQQSLIHKEDRRLDRIECADGTECWFDITDAYQQLAKSMGQ